MLEPLTTSIVLLASQFSIISGAVQSMAGSFTVIVASVGAVSLSISGAMAWVATILPVPKEVGLYSKIYTFVNIFGGNIGNAANALKKIG
jgi:hypothetical protein